MCTSCVSVEVQSIAVLIAPFIENEQQKHGHSRDIEKEERFIDFSSQLHGPASFVSEMQIQSILQLLQLLQDQQ